MMILTTVPTTFAKPLVHLCDKGLDKGERNKALDRAAKTAAVNANGARTF